MIIRKIKPEELKRTLELFAISFEFSADLPTRTLSGESAGQRSRMTIRP